MIPGHGRGEPSHTRKHPVHPVILSKPTSSPVTHGDGTSPPCSSEPIQSTHGSNRARRLSKRESACTPSGDVDIAGNCPTSLTFHNAPMRFTLREAGRLWFVACTTLVIGTPLVLVLSGGVRLASYADLLMPTFKFAWPALLVTSFIFLKFDRRLSVIGFISCLLGALWALSPVLAV